MNRPRYISLIQSTYYIHYIPTRMFDPSPTSTPIARSQQRLEYILSVYPILRSILSSSHRTSIISLGRTCHNIRSTLTSTVGPLSKSFPICMEELKQCAICHTPVCIDCSQVAVQLQKPAVLLSYNKCIYTVVGEDTPALTEAAWMAIERGSNNMFHFNMCGFSRYRGDHHYMCQFCFPNQGPGMNTVVSDKEPEWVGRSITNTQTRGRHQIDLARRLAVTEVVWEDVPRAQSGCTCPNFNPGCQSTVHLVRVEGRLVDRKLALFAWMPLSLRQGGKEGVRKYPYIVDVSPVPWQPPTCPDYHEVLRMDS